MGRNKEINSRTLYVSDMDGTLLDATSRISPESAAMLNEAISAGALFTVATARTPATVAGLLEGVDVRLPVAVMTGSALWNPATGLYSNVQYIAEDEVSKAIEIYRQCQLPTFIYTLENNLIHIYHYGRLNSEEYCFLEGRLRTPFKRAHVTLGRPERLPNRLDKVILFFAIQSTGNVREVERLLRENLRCTVQCYHDNYGPEIGLLEIFAENSSKARAIATLAREIGADRIVAFGDNINDLPMLRSADMAVAVQNAVPELKLESDLIIGPNTEDSVARFILEDFMKSSQR